MEIRVCLCIFLSQLSVLTSEMHLPGNAVSSIPKLADIHSSYNVLILTFADVDSAGNFSLDLQAAHTCLCRNPSEMPSLLVSLTYRQEQPS